LFFNLEEIQRQERMSDKAAPAPRFLVRQGFKGWMVYDRQRKGPALIGTNPAVDLTQERANNIKHMLTQSDGKPPPYSSGIESRSHGDEDRG
jgi:hypothetical protein